MPVQTFHGERTREAPNSLFRWPARSLSSVAYRLVHSPRRQSVSRKDWLDSYTHGQINRLLVFNYYEVAGLTEGTESEEY